MLIRNQSSKITATDYWGTPHAEAGYVYVSVNAGTVRLLVPPAAPPDLLPALRAAKTVAIGLAGLARARRLVIEIVDTTPDDPYVLDMDPQQCDRGLPASEAGDPVPWVAYGPGHDAEAVTELARGTATITLAEDA